MQTWIKEIAKFTNPNEIFDEECLRRVTSLVGLFNSAFQIKDWMTEKIMKNLKMQFQTLLF